MKQNVDAAVAVCPGVRRVIVLRRTGHIETLNPIDRWWHELVAQQPTTCPPEKMDSGDPLFILYTSGSTGKPKGILHTTAGYLLGELAWFTEPKKTLVWKAPFAKWFVGGKLNVSYNCIDRHLESGKRHKAAILFEGEPGDVRVLTYQQLHDEVCRFANALKAEGVKKGDRVVIYLPMVPEAAIAMLACARIGAVHSVVFGGFSSESLKDRIRDSGAQLVVTADGGYRRG